MPCRNAVNWLYKLDKDYTYQSEYEWDNDMEFLDRDGVLRMRLSRDGQITILKGYCWDGCTPKFCVMDILVGTPEGAVHGQTGKPKTWDASLVHDALCQFRKKGVPLSRSKIDGIMLDLLREREFSLAYVYYLSVFVFGFIGKPFYYWKRDYKDLPAMRIVNDDEGQEKT